MLEIRPTCENCGVQLLPRSLEAMICSFECTFCRTCVEEILANVCPNCGTRSLRRAHKGHPARGPVAVEIAETALRSRSGLPGPFSRLSLP